MPCARVRARLWTMSGTHTNSAKCPELFFLEGGMPAQGGYHNKKAAAPAQILSGKPLFFAACAPNVRQMAMFEVGWKNTKTL